MSCKKSSKDDLREEPPLTGGGKYETRDLIITFPKGLSVNKSDYTLSSLLVNATPDADGNVKAAYNKGMLTIAWLFDKNERPVMAGFLSDSTTTIDAASTAKVLLYYTYGLQFKPTVITNKFVNEIHTLKGVKEWIEDYTALFKSDLNILSNKGFTVKLKAAAEKISEEKEMVDAKISKVGDIKVDDGDVKSGLQISSVNEVLGKLSITNMYRRPAHAFFYKTEFKDNNGVQKTIMSEINATSPADRDEGIDPAEGFTSISSVLGAWIESKDYEFAAKKSGPWDFPLADNESEATYKLRIVGPGAKASLATLTNAEKFEQRKLIIETLTVDFIVPIALQIRSIKSMDDNTGNLVQYKASIAVVDNLLGTMPGVLEELIENGDFKAAAGKFFENLASPAYSEGFKLLMEGIYKGLATNLNEEYLPKLDDFNVRAGRVNQIMEIINHLMQIGDYGRILGHLVNSRPFEEWTIRIVSSQVTLKATKEVVVPYESSKISAVIKNLGNTGDSHPYFEWKTSGKYGNLSDTKGHNQQISFGSADAEVTYESRQTVSGLSENIDYIYVTVFYNNKELGKDTIAINVKPDKYTIKPDGLTLSGQEGETHTAALYLEKPDGTSEIGSSPDFDYKIVWTTSGRYGKLSGSQTNVTNFNNNRITYTVFDDKTKEATETIKARVYAKKKSEPESAYALSSEDDVSIKINNDDKKKVVHYSLIAMHFDELTGPFTDSHFRKYWYHGCANQGLVPVKEEKDAVSYSLTFSGGIVRGAPTGYNWTPGNLSFSGAADMPGSPGKYSNGTYYVFYTGLGSSASPTYEETLCCHSPSDSKYIAGVRAEVIITLK